MTKINKKDVANSLKHLPVGDEISITGVLVKRDNRCVYAYTTKYKGVINVFNTLKETVGYVLTWCK